MTMQRERKASGKFWPLTALCALVLCAWMAFVRGGSEARADNGGATAEGVIALMGTIPNREHLYLIDTNTHRIMLYESEANGGLKLVAGRNYESDNLFLGKQPGQFMLYNSTNTDKYGYYDKQIAEAISQSTGGATRKSQP